jgi:hypothetical protein
MLCLRETTSIQLETTGLAIRGEEAITEIPLVGAKEESKGKNEGAHGNTIQSRTFLPDPYMLPETQLLSVVNND